MAKTDWVIRGKIVSGVKQGAFFTQLDWVQAQCLEKLGFKPYPGTLNLELGDQNMPAVAALLSEKGVALVSPDENFCDGRACAVSVAGIPGAIVAPAEAVRVHGQNIVEVISHFNLRDALGVGDGDRVWLSPESFRKPAKGKLAVDAVIFDLDGTLIDSIPIYYRIIEIVFEELGLPPVPRQTLVEAIKDGDFDWDVVLPAKMKARKAQIVRRAKAIVTRRAPAMFRGKVQLIPGAEKILRAIAAAGIRLGLVTSTPFHSMADKLQPLETAGIGQLLEVIITADDVVKKKPAAAPLLTCSRRLGVAPPKCVYVGDTRVDIRAGKAAGMKTIGVLTGFDSFPALEEKIPDVIVDSVDLLGQVIAIQGYA